PPSGALAGSRVMVPGTPAVGSLAGNSVIPCEAVPEAELEVLVVESSDSGVAGALVVSLGRAWSKGRGAGRCSGISGIGGRPSKSAGNDAAEEGGSSGAPIRVPPSQLQTGCGTGWARSRSTRALV